MAGTKLNRSWKWEDASMATYTVRPGDTLGKIAKKFYGDARRFTLIVYAKGRTVPPIGKKYIVTKAKGGQSYHNFGLAFDIVVLDSLGKADWDTNHPGWNKAGDLGKSVGLEWGGDWKSFKDLPHFQYTGGLTLEECRELFPSGLEAIWAKVT